MNSKTVVLDSSDSYHRVYLVKVHTGYKLCYTRKQDVANNTAVLTIPAGHRPTSTKYAHAVCVHSSGKVGIGKLTVHTDGRCVLGALNYNESLRGGPFYVEW